MITTFAVALMTVVFGDFLIALYNTMNKEKVMIQSGGEPLPTSSYVFLAVKYILWVSNVMLIPSVLNLFHTLPSPDTVGAMLIVFASFLGTYVLATLEEVLIRVLIVFYVQRSRIKQLKKQTKEG